MVITINKHTNPRRPVQYAALASGTISHVWSEEEEQLQEKRKVKVLVRSESQPKNLKKQQK